MPNYSLDISSTCCFQTQATSFCINEDSSGKSVFNSNSNAFEDSICTVENKSGKKVYFFPIDKCLILEDIPKCDCALITEDNSYVIFIELKDRKPFKSDYLSEGIKQLINTISYFPSSELNRRKKQAYVANKRLLVPKNYTEQCKEFYESTGFKLFIKTKIKPKRLAIP